MFVGKPWVPIFPAKKSYCKALLSIKTKTRPPSVIYRHN